MENLLSYIVAFSSTGRENQEKTTELFQVTDKL
jgi:hypothetical protein